MTALLLVAVGVEYRAVCLAAAAVPDHDSRAVSKAHARIYRNHAARCSKAMNYLRGRLGRAL
jgi:hypothetical protein